MIKTIQIGDKEVIFKSSAAIPHIYRKRFNRDIFLDMDRICQTAKKGSDGSSHLPVDTLEIFEELAYCFAKHATPDITDDPEEWLEQFEVFDIYGILPELVTMWTDETKSLSKLKKKKGKSTVTSRQDSSYTEHSAAD